MKRLVGIWKYIDGFSDVEFKITLKNGTFVVSGVDKYDNEIPEIYGISWRERRMTLSFSAHWSSGRFTTYKFMPSPIQGRIGVTYTYTDHEVWEAVKSNSKSNGRGKNPRRSPKR
jgi:hypothetical protein